jgi:integrase
MVRKTSAKLHLLSALEVLHAGDGDLTDGGGLLLRVRAESASWVFRYTAATGKRREMGLGIAHRGNQKHAGASLELARELAGDARRMLKQRSDPIDDRQRMRDAERDKLERQKADKGRERRTLARVARDYHERVIEPSRTTKHGAQWIQSLELHVPAGTWHKPIDGVTAPELLDVMLKLQRQIPETASRVRQRLDAIFEDAMFHGYCASNPAAAIRRKLREALVKGKRKRGEFAALPYSEAPAFTGELRGAEGVAARCLEFAMLTTARTGEVIGAVWEELDLDTGIWIVPAARMKGGQDAGDHVVHLSARAIEIAKAQRQLGQPYVFPSPTLDKSALSNMAMLSLLKRMGYSKRTTVHGLCRATFSTWAHETAAARPEVIEACLAHREADKVKAAYNRAQFTEERRALLAAWAAYLATPQANVIPLRAA